MIEGEFVIYIIVGLDCCFCEMDFVLSFEDFFVISFFFEYIGNWRYWDFEYVEFCFYSWRFDCFVDIIFGLELIMCFSVGIVEIVCFLNSSLFGDIKFIKEIVRKC